LTRLVTGDVKDLYQNMYVLGYAVAIINTHTDSFRRRRSRLARGDVDAKSLNLIARYHPLAARPRPSSSLFARPPPNISSARPGAIIAADGRPIHLVSIICTRPSDWFNVFCRDFFSDTFLERTTLRTRAMHTKRHHAIIERTAEGFLYSTKSFTSRRRISLS
jgi:hypothetical protein